MKYFITILLSTIIYNGFAQQYETSRDQHGAKVLKGIISKDILMNDTAFAWFQQNQTAYTPNAAVVENIKKATPGMQLVVFGGTWCDDTRQILPKFYTIADAAGFAADKITLLGVDRNKKTLSHLAEAFGITNVPTFIVMKDGKELGRVIEYGKTGQWDKEIADIISAAVK
jgi:thiol-disulfide isomerase/thioredoxin